MSRIRPWIALAAAAVAYFAVSLFVGSPSAVPAYPAGTSYSPLPDGTKALYLLLQEPPAKGAGRIVVPSASGLAAAPAILIEAPQQTGTSASAQGWLTAVRQGSRLVELTGVPTSLTAALRLSFGPVLPSQGGRAGWTLEQGAPGGSPTPTRWAVADLGSVRPLLGARPSDREWTLRGTGRPPTVVGVTRRIGKGTVTILTLPDLAFNAHIAKAQNLAVLLGLLEPDQNRVGFVETAHGYSMTPGALALFGPGLRTALLLAAIAVILWLWSEGRRFGEPAPLVPPKQEASLEYAQALARHHKKAKDYGRLLGDLDEYALNRHNVSLSGPSTDRAEIRRPRDFLRAVNKRIETIRSKDRREDY